MNDRPVGPRHVDDAGRSLAARASVREQRRRRGALELQGFQPHPATIGPGLADAIAGSREPGPVARAAHGVRSRALGGRAAALAAGSCPAAEHDLRWRGAQASGLRLPLARAAHRGAGSAHRARFAAGPSRSRGAGRHDGAVAAAKGRAAGRRCTDGGSRRVPCGAAGTRGREDHAEGPAPRSRDADGEGQAEAKGRERRGARESALAEGDARRGGESIDPRPRRDRCGAVRRADAGRARRRAGAGARHCRITERLEPADSDRGRSRSRSRAGRAAGGGSPGSRAARG